MVNARLFTICSDVLTRRTVFVSIVIAIVCLPLFALHPLPTQTSSLFSGSGKCAGCHQASMMMGSTALKENGVDVSPVTLWRSSMMGNSAKDPLWRAKVSTEIVDHPELQTLIENECPRCHAPMGYTQAMMDGTGPYTIAAMVRDTLALDGISCTACHQIMDTLLGTPACYSGNFQIGMMREIYGPFANPSDMMMMMRVNYMPMQGAHMNSSALCGSCHMLFTPIISDSHQVTGQFPEQETYLEWFKSAFPAQNIQCQTCHMPQASDSIRIATMPMRLEKRAPFYKEFFAGGNAFMQGLFHDNIDRLGLTAEPEHYENTRMRTLASLQSQSINLEAQWAQDGDFTDVTVRIVNRTGHKLPTGIPFRRRIWIHVYAQNSNLETIWESGAWDASGEIVGLDTPYEPHYQNINSPDQVQVYEDVMRDLNGNVTLGFLRAADYVKDNRIPPAGFDSAACYNDTVAIHGSAIYDPDFNRYNGVWGTGADVVHYRVPTAAGVAVEVCYQSVAPELIRFLRNYTTPEVARFDSLYSGQYSGPVIMARTVLGTVNDAPAQRASQALNCALQQNYPNPFNPSTNLSFDLATAGHVTLGVYNLLGERVAVMVNGTLSPGRHTFAFDGSRLPSGLYFYRLEANGFTDQKKMLLIK
jgi:hypothetical protein